MRENHRIWQRVQKYYQTHRITSIVTGHLVVAFVLGSILLGTAVGSTVLGAFAQSPCSSGDGVYSVRSGDTLGSIAGRYNTTWQKLASYNHIGNANMIYIDEHICIPGKATAPTSGLTSPVGAAGFTNVFVFPQCTNWANERYHQIHGVFVPWTTNANAWQWVARAYDFRWKVSSAPSVGSIVVLQPWIQGAYGLGHVAVVERVMSNGMVIASNTNWGAFPYQVSNSQIWPGYGVSFISR